MSRRLLSGSTAGVFAIAVTPFDEAGGVDYGSLDTLLEFYQARGVHGLTILGVMGEAHKLGPEESLAITRHVLRRVGDAVSVVVGVSGTAFGVMETLSRTAMDAGAAGVMVAPIAGLRMDEQVYAYYARVFDVLGTGVPVVYQDYPQTTGVHLSVSLFCRLVRDHPQLVMLKHEDCPGLDKLSRIRRDTTAEGHRRISILVGNGALYYPLELQRGADGAMTGFAYPEMLVDVYERHRSGDVGGAEDVFDAYLPLLRYEQQPGMGLAIRKEILMRRKAIATARVRAPGYTLSHVDHAELDRLMHRLERRIPAAVR